MNNITGLIYSLLAQTSATEEGQQAADAVAVGGMRWDGWLMLVIGILLLYGGLAWCLWIAAGRGRKEAWTEEEEEEEEPEPQIIVE
jgi:hypothetical protein